MPIVWNSGSLSFLGPSGPVQAYLGIALPLLCYYAAQHFLVRIYSNLVFTCTIFSPSPLPFSLNPFDIPAYYPLHSSLLLCILSFLHYLNSVLDHALKFVWVTTGIQDLVSVLTSWVYLSYVCIIFNFS